MLDIKALFRAIKLKDIEQVQAIIISGVNVNKVDEKQGTPLHQAICQKELTCVKLLLQAGANVHAQNKSGRTPLQTAMQFFPEAVPLLRAKGARFDYVDTLLMRIDGPY